MPKKKSKPKSARKPKPRQVSKAPRATNAVGPTVVQVPKTDPSAFNPDRLAGKLLLSQVAHLREALVKHGNEVTALASADIRNLRTEGQVSDYIHKVTAILHPHAAHSSKA
jgi:hypothetical protein